LPDVEEVYQELNTSPPALSTFRSYSVSLSLYVNKTSDLKKQNKGNEVKPQNKIF